MTTSIAEAATGFWWPFPTETIPEHQRRVRSSVVFRTRAVGIDFLDASAGERGKLFHNRAVDQDAQAMTAHRPVLQWPAIDDNLSRLISRAFKGSCQRDLIARP
jgi:hypothetical protein